MEAFVRAHHVVALVAALAIGIGAKQYLFPPIKASQIKVAQSNLGLAIAPPDSGNSDRMEIASVKTLLRPVSDAESVERANDQPRKSRFANWRYVVRWFLVERLLVVVPHDEARGAFLDHQGGGKRRCADMA
jgi:hypothetical protein